MFEAFDSTYKPDVSALMPEPGGRGGVAPELQLFLDRYGGLSFNNGIYRALSAESAAQSTEYVVHAYPTYSGHIICFGIDWLGRIFALDARRLEQGLPGVVMFEPGTGDCFTVPCNIVTFHNSELVQYGEDVLAEPYYKTWLANGGQEPLINQCVGYIIPLFLGGRDEVSNLELSDLDVYWHLLSQLIRQTRGLPAGTPVGPITLTDPD
ncbi:T6SS immunity protein Tdi1 domain-containing protein [Achromobacter mucicolens]|uniref:T6SS immunity protein Tdi1 domain-containing protein n=1 Tax=Achromobacter mucicolens TaxID=1389922 RepID=UPI003974C249